MFCSVYDSRLGLKYLVLIAKGRWVVKYCNPMTWTYHHWQAERLLTVPPSQLAAVYRIPKTAELI